MKQVVAVAIGGMSGTWLRAGLSVLMGDLSFPWATLLVNWAGCFSLAWLLHSPQGKRLPDEWKLGLGTGLIGSFTTFSAFSGEMLALEGLAARAAYAFLSIGGGLLLAWLGARAAEPAMERGRQHG